MSDGSRSTDIVVIGAGPAGLSAAIWARDIGLRCTVIDARPEPGGQLNSIYSPIRNYPGIEQIDGPRLANDLMLQARRAGAELIFGESVVSILSREVAVLTASGSVFNAKAIVAATGVRRRRLGVPGESEYLGRGILDSGAKRAGELGGSRVTIIGGGDAAIENAVLLGRAGAIVTVIHRGAEFSARDEFLNAAERLDNVTLLRKSNVLSIFGDDRVTSVEVAGADGLPVNIDTDAVLIRIGWEPNSDLLREHVRLDERGYAITDNVGRTDVSGIYAVGDVSCLESPTIVTAAGSGAAAVKAIYNDHFTPGT